MKSRIVLLIAAVWMGWLSTASAILQWPLTVTNIAELKSLHLADVVAAETAYTASTSPAVYVLGYYKPGDRGGGMFEWDPNSSGTLDGGRFFATNGWTSGNGRWVRRFAGDVPNVRMWGAKGDIDGGVESPGNMTAATDDTTAIQNAIKAINLPADSGFPPCELLVPAGFYKITDTLIFQQLLKIRGENARMTHIVMPYGVNKDILRSLQADQVLHGTNGTLFYDENVRIEDIGLDFATETAVEGQQGHNLTNSAIVVIQPEEGTTIRNVNIINAGIGIRCFGGGGGADASFRDIVCSGCAIAGICVEPVPSASNCAGQVTITGITGDHRWDDTRSNACLVKFVDYCGPAYIEGVNAEGIYGGGIIHHKFPAALYFYDLGNLTIKNGTLNSGGSYSGNEAPHGFVVLESAGWRTTAVTIENIHAYNCTNLILDLLSPRNVTSPDSSSMGLHQGVVRLPLEYEAYNSGGVWPDGVTGDKYSRLVVGDQAIYSFVPPTTNAWYRILQQNNGWPFLGSKVAVSSFSESSEFNVNILAVTDPNAVELNVTRTMKANAWPYPPCVTKVRAGSYQDTSGNTYPFTDIYVERAIPYLGFTDYNFYQITVACPIYDMPGLSANEGRVFLKNPTTAVSSLVPSGCTLINCVTNSLVR